jgi:hypothetical protein
MKEWIDSKGACSELEDATPVPVSSISPQIRRPSL